KTRTLSLLQAQSNLWTSRIVVSPDGYRPTLFVLGFNGILRRRADALCRPGVTLAGQFSPIAGCQCIDASSRARAARHLSVGHRQRKISLGVLPGQGRARL